MKTIITAFFLSILLLSCNRDLPSQEESVVEKVESQMESAENYQAKLQIINAALDAHDLTALRVLQIKTLYENDELLKAEERINNYYRDSKYNPDFLILAARVFSELRQAHPEKSEAYFFKAKSLYHQTLELDPDHKDANYLLGIMLYNRSLEIMDAVKVNKSNLNNLEMAIEKGETYLREARYYLTRAKKQDSLGLIKPYLN